MYGFDEKSWGELWLELLELKGTTFVTQKDKTADKHTKTK